MIIWINGAFGAGKTTVAYELNRRLSQSIIYDPETAGYFLRKSLPKAILKSDFQDHVAWRDINFSVLYTLSQDYSGPVIVPMTIVNPQYFNEIITRLRASGMDVHHFTLLASRQTLMSRIKKRGEGKQSWPVQQIERCVASLTSELFEAHIETDNVTPDEIIRMIAKECKLELAKDNRSMLKKLVDRLIFRLKHIRL